jgi:hypothetical protein
MIGDDRQDRQGPQPVHVGTIFHAAHLRDGSG